MPLRSSRNITFLQPFNRDKREEDRRVGRQEQTTNFAKQ